MVFTPEQMQLDIDTFTGNVGQYVFISSASVYEKPARHYVITEKTPAVNPYWAYSQDKIACEELLRKQKKLPWTIVRPSHTVRSGLPTMMNEGDIVAHRMLAGKPVIVCGRRHDAVDADAVRGPRGALHQPVRQQQGARRGYSTSPRTAAITWDDIYKAIARGLGVEAKIVHVPTDTLVRYNSDWEGPLLGDKTWSALFDNCKVKRVAGDFTCSEDLDVGFSPSRSGI